MSGKLRLAVFASALWLLLAIGVGIAADDTLAVFVFLGIAPLFVIWGVWWVEQGFKSSKPKSPLELAKPIVPKGSYFVRLWRGDVGLAVTFWFWGFFVFLAIRLLDLYAESHQLLVLKHMGWYYLFMAVSFAYSVFIWVAIWSSAGKSSSAVGPGLARLWVVLGMIQTVATFTEINQHLTRTTYSESDLWSMAHKLNKSLPTNLDEITVLESASIQDRSMIYKHKVTLSEGFLNLNIIKENGLPVICTDNLSRRMLNDGIIFTYTYHDEYGAPMGTFDVVKDDCEL